MSTPPSQVTPPAPPSPPYTVANIEGAAVAFLGGFAGSLVVVGASLLHASEVGALAFAVYLGYTAYQNS
jgi:predicted lipid-binding transport protein (Tim44 family)